MGLPPKPVNAFGPTPCARPPKQKSNRPAKPRLTEWKFSSSFSSHTYNGKIRKWFQVLLKFSTTDNTDGGGEFTKTLLLPIFVFIRDNPFHPWLIPRFRFPAFRLPLCSPWLIPAPFIKKPA
jgi:hypothetical protein